MSLSLDTSNPFRYPSELTKLVRAVREATDNDESRWIEWKSTLDLGDQGAIHHLVRQILGFSNRDPVVAERWAGGYGYILIGVSPGQLQGVQAIDPEQLVNKLRPYIGSEVVWTPEYVLMDGVNVLVIIVDPPQSGDMIRTLRKPLKPYEAGAVLMRRPGQVERADPDEMIMLQRRLLSGTPHIGVSVAASTSLERIPDICTLIDRQAKQARHDCLVSLTDGSRRKPALRSGANFADQRSVEDYVTEVDAYVDRLSNVLAARAVNILFSHSKASLQVEIASESDRPFTDIHLRIDIKGAVHGYDGDLYDLGAIEPPALPKPPRPFGTPSQLAVTGSHFSNMFSSVNDYAHLMRRGEVDWHIENGNTGVGITFDPFDLRPGMPRILPAVPLYVTAAVGHVLELSWMATAGNANGWTTGTGHILVDETSVDLESVLSIDDC